MSRMYNTSGNFLLCWILMEGRSRFLFCCLKRDHGDTGGRGMQKALLFYLFFRKPFQSRKTSSLSPRMNFSALTLSVPLRHHSLASFTLKGGNKCLARRWGHQESIFWGDNNALPHLGETRVHPHGIPEAALWGSGQRVETLRPGSH